MTLNFPASPSNGDTYDNFVYDGTKGAWKLVTIAGNDLTDLNDVTITTPADGQALVYDSSSGDWVNEAVAADLSGINDIPDVTITGTPADNEVLAYDNSSGDWINQTAAEAGIATETYVQENFSTKLLLETDEKTTDYTLVIGDVDKIVQMNKSGAATLTVPLNSSVSFAVGTIIGVYNLSSDDVTVSGDSGVTVRNAGKVGQFSEVSLRKRDTDEWVMVGG
jgi:hypothetical protein